MNYMMFHPYDRITTEVSGRKREWKVNVVYLGGETQESVIGLIPVDLVPVSGENDGEMLVPEDILEAGCRAGCFAHYVYMPRVAD
jgi:hypothetical protein